jgi:hypothetical protein
MLVLLPVFLFFLRAVVGSSVVTDGISASVSVGVTPGSSMEDRTVQNFTESSLNNELENIRFTYSAQFQTLRNLILGGRCKHLYIDLGTNIGIQQRKLYEPEYFPDSPSLPYFDRMFGNESKDGKIRSDVCSIGFEPGPIHTQRLIQLQDAYQKAGYPMVVFTSTAAWTQDSTMTFYEDRFSPEPAHQHGSSLLKVHENMIPHEVLTIDIVRFLREIFLLWDKYQLSALRGANRSHPVTGKSGVDDENDEKEKYFFHPDKSRVLLKMDIEGAEYSVFPHLIGHGLLCSINTMIVEFHRDHVTNEEHDNLINFMNYFATKIKNCHMQIVELDDETYGRGEDDRPLPLPQIAMN